MVLYMKLTNTVLFKCLCLDLGMTYVHNELNVVRLGDLKDRFLELSEARFPAESTDQWIRDFQQEIRIDRALTSEAIRTNAEVFKNLYQVLSWSLKIRKPHTKQQEEAYVSKFLVTEQTTKAWKVDRSNPITRLARWLVRRSCASLDTSSGHVVQYTRDGPGASFDGEVGSDKHHVSPPPEQLLRYAPYDLFFANEEFWIDNVKAETHFERSDCKPRGKMPFTSQDVDKYRRRYVARVGEFGGAQKRFIESRLTLVPKSYKGPRGVFISPKEAMKWQLGLDETLKRFVNTSWFGRCYDPKDQLPSGLLAYEGSYTRWFSTLDLSDASDRVPLSLVAHLFHRQDYLSLARTRPCYCWLPNGKRHRLGMFSPMGDGKTFPILTIICAVISVAACMVQDGVIPARPPSLKEVGEYVEKVRIRIFGDDIIVPTEYFSAVIAALEIHNLKVNVRKSFSFGFFREACGVDAYHGKDVTPLRQKEDLETVGRGVSLLSTSSCESLQGLIALCNACTVRGFEKTAFALSAHIRQISNNRVGLTTDISKNPSCLYVPRLTPRDCSRCPLAFGPSKDMSRCMWCGSNGLIRHLDRLHIRVKYDSLNQRLMQRVLVPSVIEYEQSLTPWWDLNHSLFPKQQRYQLFARNTVKTGSLESERIWERACRDMRLMCYTSPGGGLRLSWVPVI